MTCCNRDCGAVFDWQNGTILCDLDQGHEGPHKGIFGVVTEEEIKRAIKKGGFEVYKPETAEEARWEK